MGQPTATNVRLDGDVRERLDTYAARTHRTLTASMNLLLDFALQFAEAGQNLDAVLDQLGKDTGR